MVVVEMAEPAEQVAQVDPLVLEQVQRMYAQLQQRKQQVVVVVAAEIMQLPLGRREQVALEAATLL